MPTPFDLFIDSWRARFGSEPMFVTELHEFRVQHGLIPAIDQTVPSDHGRRIALGQMLSANALNGRVRRKQSGTSIVYWLEPDDE